MEMAVGGGSKFFGAFSECVCIFVCLCLCVFVFGALSLCLGERLGWPRWRLCSSEEGATVASRGPLPPASTCRMRNSPSQQHMPLHAAFKTVSKKSGGV